MRRRVPTAVLGSLLLVGCADHSTSTDPLFTEHVWNVFLSDVRGHRWPEAHDKMVSLYQADHTPADLHRAVAANPLLSRHTQSATNSFGVCEGRPPGGQCADGWLDTRIGKVRFTLTYVDEGATEKVVTLSVADVPVLGVGVPPPTGGP